MVSPVVTVAVAAAAIAQVAGAVRIEMPGDGANNGAFYDKTFGFPEADGIELINSPDRLERVNAKAKDLGWTAGANERLEGATLKHVQRMLGTFTKGHPSYQRLPEKEYGALRANLPDNFDSRTEWPDCPSIAHIRDQSDCGSCWAFGSTESFNDRLCIKAGHKGLLAVEDTTSCCGSFGCGFSMGCNGGQPSGAWSWFQHKGVVTGGDYNDTAADTCQDYKFPPCAHHVTSPKYQPCPSSEYPTPSCATTCQDGYSGDYKSDKIKASKAYSVSGVTNIMQEIMEHGPVTAAFTVFDDFPTYKSGVYTHTPGSSPLGGHAIEIIGWGVEDGKDYWLVKNSWNDSWGDGGTFKIARGTDECGIEDDISTGLP